MTRIGSNNYQQFTRTGRGTNDQIVLVVQSTISGKYALIEHEVSNRLVGARRLTRVDVNPPLSSRLASNLTLAIPHLSNSTMLSLCKSFTPLETLDDGSS